MSSRLASQTLSFPQHRHVDRFQYRLVDIIVVDNIRLTVDAFQLFNLFWKQKFYAAFLFYYSLIYAKTWIGQQKLIESNQFMV